MNESDIYVLLAKKTLGYDMILLLNRAASLIKESKYPISEYPEKTIK
ncbi:MAG: hypothetical protein QM660_11725 [Dysgonomonas sp.]